MPTQIINVPVQYYHIVGKEHALLRHAFFNFWGIDLHVRKPKILQTQGGAMFMLNAATYLLKRASPLPREAFDE